MKLNDILFITVILFVGKLPAQVPSNVPSNGLKAWYPFSGNANDLSGTNLNGTVVGATLTTDRNGTPNSAYSFTTNQQINIPNSTALNYYPLTISLWYNASLFQTGAQTNIFSKYVASSWNGYQIVFGDNTNISNNGGVENNGFGTQAWYVRSTNNKVIGYYGEQSFLQPNINLNTWYHYVFVLDSSGGKIYVNGQLISSHNWTGTAGACSNSYLWKIGGQYEVSSWFNGKIDDVGIWNRALSSSEIQQLYSGCVATAPIGSVSQTFCSGSTIANLTATGTNIQWYSTSTGGIQLDTTTTLVNNSTYFASQTVNGCESPTRLAVLVSLNTPTLSASATTVCSGSSVELTATGGDNLQQIDNKTAQFSNNVSNIIGISYDSQSIPVNNFSYDFWFNTSRTITLLSEKTGGVSVQGINGQNFVVIPDFYNIPYFRGTGVSVGTNGISVVEHCGNFFDSRLTYTASLIGWHHCAVVYQNNAFTFYLDGNLISSRTNGSNFGNFGTQYNNVGLLQTIGKGYTGNDPNDNYTGQLDEYRQWSVALSAAQIAQIYARKLQSINMAECNLNLTFDQNSIANSSTISSGVTLSNTSLPAFNSDNTFQIGGFTGTTINNLTTNNFSGASSSVYLWSTGETTSTINVNPTSTTQYWVDVTTNGITCRKEITITVTPSITPTFASVGPICFGDPLLPLSLASNEGITGTWSPTLNNTATTTYTFAPAAGQCASSTNLTINVNSITTPTFTQVGPYINGATIPALPTISTNNISGTWSPTINNTATTTYTFTPNAGQCGNGTTMTIAINAPLSYNLTASDASVCAGTTVTLSMNLNGVYRAGTVHCLATPTAVVDVTNPITGKTWMDRNLGASQVATSSTDALAYGDLYQWGRGADGHQCRNSATTTTVSSSDQPGNGSFVIQSGDWRNPANSNLWQGLNGINNPCPIGYRVPTISELDAERLSWTSQNSSGAFSSPLKLSLVGVRNINGVLQFVSSNSRYWSSNVPNSAQNLFFSTSNAYLGIDNRSNGSTVRCIKD
jgi:hypothetical protein